MKQKLLSVVLLLFCALQMSAQSFNEEQLEGTWEFKDEVWNIMNIWALLRR